MGKKMIEEAYREFCAVVHEKWDESARGNIGIEGEVKLRLWQDRKEEVFSYAILPHEDGRLLKISVRDKTLNGFSTTDDPAAYIVVIEPTIKNLFMTAFVEAKELFRIRRMQ